jgi:hypothetical protein
MEFIETKHLVALIILIGFGSLSLLLTLISQRMRDVALFGLVFGAVLIEKMNVTFLGTFWYRGTSRGIEISALDVVPLCLLIATLLLPRYERGRFYWPASLGLMLLYFAYCCVSVLNADPQIHGVWELSKMFRGLLVFLAAALFIRTRRELGVVVLALCCAASMEGLNAFEQRFFRGAFRAPGTLDHENTLSTYFCTIGPVLVAAAMSNWSKWLRWFAGLSWLLAAGGELLTLSRLGVPVFAFVSLCTALACTSWKITKQKLAIVAAVAVAMGVFVFFSWDGLRARYASGNVKAELTTAKGVETRGVYWRIASLMIQDHPYGVGLNNWSYYVGKTYGRELGYDYHDYDEFKWVPTREDAAETLLPPAADTLPALTIGELGIAGLVVFLLGWLRWFQMGTVFLGNRLNDDPVHRIALGVLFGTLGIFIQSATEWTYRQTAVMFTFHVLLGALASMYRTRKRARREAKQLAYETSVDVEVDPLPVPVARAVK